MVEQPQWEPEEPTPSYLRPRFVLAVVISATLLGLGIFAWGNSGTVVLTPEGEVASSLPEREMAPEVVPEAASPETCPEPGKPVELEAAELISLFGASATGGGFASLPATEEVIEQVDATTPPVTRMTRIRGFEGEPGSWSTCVVSSWSGPEGPEQSLDVVTVELVAGADRSDLEEAGSGSRRKKDLEDRWEVTSWLRGVAVPAPELQVATVAFYNSDRGCRRPDRQASVLIADEAPSNRLVAALEELISGTPGRANTASSKIPPDIQVIEAEVSAGGARVVLSPTSDDSLSKCDGTAAFEQVRDTAAAIVGESLPGADANADGTDSDVAVEVIVAGKDVTTLAP